jgi:hypothetical protein
MQAMPAQERPVYPTRYRFLSGNPHPGTVSARISPAQNSGSAVAHTATRPTRLPYRTAATCAHHVGPAATVRDGSPSAATVSITAPG